MSALYARRSTHCWHEAPHPSTCRKKHRHLRHCLATPGEQTLLCACDLQRMRLSDHVCCAPRDGYISLNESCKFRAACILVRIVAPAAMAREPREPRANDVYKLLFTAPLKLPEGRPSARTGAHTALTKLTVLPACKALSPCAPVPWRTPQQLHTPQGAFLPRFTATSNASA